MGVNSARCDRRLWRAAVRPRGVLGICRPAAAKSMRPSRRVRKFSVRAVAEHLLATYGHGSYIGACDGAPSDEAQPLIRPVLVARQDSRTSLMISLLRTPGHKFWWNPPSSGVINGYGHCEILQ